MVIEAIMGSVSVWVWALLSALLIGGVLIIYWWWVYRLVWVLFIS